MRSQRLHHVGRHRDAEGFVFRRENGWLASEHRPAIAASIERSTGARLMSAVWSRPDVRPGFWRAALDPKPPLAPSFSSSKSRRSQRIRAAATRLSEGRPGITSARTRSWAHGPSDFIANTLVGRSRRNAPVPFCKAGARQVLFGCTAMPLSLRRLRQPTRLLTTPVILCKP